MYMYNFIFTFINNRSRNEILHEQGLVYIFD